MYLCIWYATRSLQKFYINRIECPFFVEIIILNLTFLFFIKGFQKGHLQDHL